MAPADLESERYRDFAFAAADLLVLIDAQGRILEASGDAQLLHHPTADRLIGKDAFGLIAEGDAQRLRSHLWALGSEGRVSFDDRTVMEDGRRFVVRRDRTRINCFNLLVSRRPASLGIQTDSADDILIEQFRDAVMNGRLMAALQPIVHTCNGQISHYEVLARFSGHASPIALIMAAERGGQICHLDYIMVEAAALRLSLNPDPDYRLAVNISGATIQRPEVVAELCAAIRGHDFQPGRLIVEVTESARVVDMQAAAHGVRKLRGCGVSVALDDFGAGAASFGYLRSLEVDGLKLDGSFLDSSSDEGRNLTLVRALARICAEYGISAVGERVETEKNRRLLQRAGIELAQGYLFGSPVIADAFFDRRPCSARNAA